MSPPFGLIHTKGTSTIRTQEHKSHRSLFWHISHTAVSKTGLKYRNVNYKRHGEPWSQRQQDGNRKCVNGYWCTVTSEVWGDINYSDVIFNNDFWCFEFPKPAGEWMVHQEEWRKTWGSHFLHHFLFFFFKQWSHLTLVSITCIYLYMGFCVKKTNAKKN